MQGRTAFFRLVTGGGVEKNARSEQRRTQKTVACYLWLFFTRTRFVVVVACLILWLHNKNNLLVLWPVLSSGLVDIANLLLIMRFTFVCTLNFPGIPNQRSYEPAKSLSSNASVESQLIGPRKCNSAHNIEMQSVETVLNP